MKHWLDGVPSADRDRLTPGPRPIVRMKSPPTALPEYQDDVERLWVVDDGLGVKVRPKALTMTKGEFFRERKPGKYTRDKLLFEAFRKAITEGANG